MKPLLVILQFRRIPQVLEAIKDLRIDKLWVKWYGQMTIPDAYSVAREEFLKRKEFTHFMLLTDDVVVWQNDLDLLISDALAFPGYQVISGWFNNDLTTHSGDTNFSFSLPRDPPSGGSYEAYNFEPIIKIYTSWNENMRGPIIPVMHQGTALTLFTREIIEEVPFRSSNGCCNDACLSLDLAAKGIKQYVDLRCRCLHLKINESLAWRISEVTQHLPEIVYEPIAV